MIKYLSAHRATIVAIVGVVLTYLSAKYGTTPGYVQEGLQIAIPIAAVLGVHIAPSTIAPSTPTPRVAAPQAKHAAPAKVSAPVSPQPTFTAVSAPYIPAPPELASFTIDTREGLLCRA